MQILRHKVLAYENLYIIMNKYNLTMDMIVNSNSHKYPSLLTDPFRLYEGWEIDIPIVISGNNTQYEFEGGE